MSEENKNYDEYDATPLTMEEAIVEAKRCLNCKKPGCITGCPISNDIPDFIHQLSRGNFGEARTILAGKTNLPAVCGRVCPHEKQCEGHCVLNRTGKPIRIGKLEQFIADFDADMNLIREKIPPKTRGNVAVIGSGPAGLTVAGDLAMMGFNVTVYEAEDEPGGVLLYGIPEFRLPKEVVRRETKRISELGVSFICNSIVGRDITIDQMFESGFDAVFIGTGTAISKELNIPGKELTGVIQSHYFLRMVALYNSKSLERKEVPVDEGDTVLVIGAGNVAMDAARTALRLGAETHIVYRRSEAELPARKEEVHHAKEEGVIFDLLENPTEILVDENGWVKGVKLIKMELGEPDASGRRSPIEIAGSEYEMECDTVIMSLGTSPNPLISSTTIGLDTNKRKCIVATEDTGATSKEGVFAGGDAVTGAATVILAMGAGKAAARGIDEFLSAK